MRNLFSLSSGSHSQLCRGGGPTVHQRGVPRHPALHRAAPGRRDARAAARDQDRGNRLQARDERD